MAYAFCVGLVNIINNILNGQRMEQNFETGTRWSIVDDSIWEPPLWTVIVSIALAAATFLSAISIGQDLKSLTETHVLTWDSWLFFRIFCMAIFGACAAAFAFANAALLFRNVKVWLRRISIINKSTYKFQH